MSRRDAFRPSSRATTARRSLAGAFALVESSQCHATPSLCGAPAGIDARSHSEVHRGRGRRARLSRNSQPQTAVSPGRHSGLGSPLPAGRKFHAPRSSRAGRGRRVLRLAPAGLRHGIWLARLTVSGSTRPGDDSSPRPNAQGPRRFARRKVAGSGARPGASGEAIRPHPHEGRSRRSSPTPGLIKGAGSGFGNRSLSRSVLPKEWA